MTYGAKAARILAAALIAGIMAIYVYERWSAIPTARAAVLELLEMPTIVEFRNEQRA